MSFASSLIPILAQGTAPDGAAGAQGMKTLLIFGVMALIFWFILIRPQMKQEKERRAMLDALKKKDRVVTSGGMYGTIADVRDDVVTVRISENPDVKVRVKRSSVVEILEDGPKKKTGG